MSGWAGHPARSRERTLRTLAGAALLFGISCLARAGCIDGKAMLAQVLIARAWERATPDRPASAPWPWADTRPIAKLRLPPPQGRARARALFVLEGSSGRNLAFGPAHDTASVLPGARGNSVIEGHRDTHFAALRTLRPHDRIEIELPAHRRMTFEIVDVRVVDSRLFRIALDAPSARLTLVTCYPFDALRPGGPLRFVVTADRV